MHILRTRRKRTLFRLSFRLKRAAAISDRALPAAAGEYAKSREQLARRQQALIKARFGSSDRGALGTAQQVFYYGNNSGEGNLFVVNLTASNTLQIFMNGAGTYVWTSSAVFRDPSPHMHITIGVDTTPATPVLSVEVNGVVQTGSIERVATAELCFRLGLYEYSGGSAFTTAILDAVISEVRWIDGQ